MPAASPTRPRSTSAGSPPTSARRRRGRRAAPRRRRRDLRARRLRHPRHRGQARRPDATPATPRDPHPRPLPGPAVHGHRVRPQRGRASTKAGSTEFDPDSPEPGHRHDGGAEGHRRRRGRPRRHDAARALPGRARAEGRVVARGVRRGRRSSERHRHRYEVNNAYREQLAEAGLVVLAVPPPTSASSSSSSCRATCTRTTSPPRRTPSSRSRPTRPHPLFAGLIGAAIEQQRAARLVEVERPRTAEPADARA